MPTYDRTMAKQTATFRDPDAALVDPTVVILKFKSTDTETTTWTYGVSGSIVRVSTGVYTARFTTTAGQMVSEWDGAGVAVGVWSRKIEATPL